MKNIFYLLLAAVCILTSCDMYDEPKDSVKEVVMTVSSETGVKYAFGDDSRTHPIECMLVMLADAPRRMDHPRIPSDRGFQLRKRA